MRKRRIKFRIPLRWKQFSHKGYSLFSALGKEVLIGTLSIPTLAYAKADGIGVKPLVATVDSVEMREASLDEVEVIASQTAATAAQSPQIITVITRDELSQAPITSINDALKAVPSVDVRQRGGFGVQTDISIDGGTFDQITLLLNGVDISNTQTGHNAADFPISINDIDHVEILKGTSAQTFGSPAFNGAINIVTKPASHDNVRVSGEGGSFGTFGGNATVTLNYANWRNQVSAGYRQSDGGTENSGFIEHKTYYQGDWKSYYVNLKWQAGISSKDYGANTFYSSSFPDQYEATRRYLVSIGGDIHGLPANLIINPTVFWRRDLDHYQLTHGMAGAANGENYHKMDVYGMTISARANWTLGRTAIGAGIRKEHIISTSLGNLLPTTEWKHISGSDRDYDHLGNRTNTNIFIEHDVNISRFTLSAGLLSNINTGLDNKLRLYPEIDLNYSPSEAWKLYASWNKALRVPTFTDLYTSNSAQQGDPNLKPEENSMVKLGAHYWAKGLEVTLNAFYSDGTNMIDWVYVSSSSTKYQAMNIGELNNMGASIAATLIPTDFMPKCLITRVNIGYAYINQTHKTEQEVYKSLYALEYLRHKLTLSVDHRIFSRLKAGWTLRWQRRMNGYLPYAKIDGKLTWDADHYNIYVQADNITAHQYYDLGGIRQPGLWVMAGFSVTIE